MALPYGSILGGKHLIDETLLVTAMAGRAAVLVQMGGAPRSYPPDF